MDFIVSRCLVGGAWLTNLPSTCGVRYCCFMTCKGVLTYSVIYPTFGLRYHGLCIVPSG